MSSEKKKKKLDFSEKQIKILLMASEFLFSLSGPF